MIKNICKIFHNGQVEVLCEIPSDHKMDRWEIERRARELLGNEFVKENWHLLSYECRKEE